MKRAERFANSLVHLGGRVQRLLERRAALILLLVSFVVFSVLAVFVIGKYRAFDYQGLDLAIYNQVLWNTVHGAPFAFSIHPHLYLGDHWEFILLLLAPLYALFQHPITLLLLQAAVLVSAVWPAFLLFSRRLPRWMTVVLSVGFLFTPFLWNAALFEFHALVFALPLLLWLLVAYERERFGWFLLLFVLAAAVREDIGLILAGIGVVAAIERRELRWVLPPILLGITWFTAATQLSGLLSGYGKYKYLAYYSHLGGSLSEILTSIFTQPLTVLTALFGGRAILFVLGLFLPVLYVSFLKPKWLIPLLPPLLALLLSRSKPEIILKIHYPIAMVPFLFLALRDVLGTLFSKEFPHSRVFAALRDLRGGVLFALLITFAYSFVVMSPVSGIVREIPQRIGSERTRLAAAVLRGMTTQKSLATSYGFLPENSSQETLVSLHYVFSGRKQYSEEPYTPPPVMRILFDAQDMLIYHSSNPHAEQPYRTGGKRMLNYAKENNLTLSSVYDSFVLWEKSGEGEVALNRTRSELPEGLVALPHTPKHNLALRGWTTPSSTLRPTEETVRGETFSFLPITLYWEKQGEIEEMLFFTFALKNGGETLWEERYPVAYGLFPPFLWENGEIVATDLKLLLPRNVPDGTEAVLTIEELDSTLALSPTNGIMVKLRERAAGETVVLGQLVFPAGVNR